MTLAELSQVAVSLGTLFSIGYAALQIRNNARAVRAATIQHHIASFTSHWDEVARNPEMTGLLLRGLDDFESLDRLEKMRARFALTSMMRRWENVWSHMKDGTLQEGDLPSTRSQEVIASAPCFWSARELIKDQSGAGFVNYVDKLVMAQKSAAGKTGLEATAMASYWAQAGHLGQQTSGSRRKVLRRKR